MVAYKGSTGEFYLLSMLPHFNLKGHRGTSENIHQTKAALVDEWTDQAGTQASGASGHFVLGGLPWLINDRDKSVDLLLVFSTHYNQPQLATHYEYHPRFS